MKPAEIEAKIVELALIYQDETQGAESVVAKKLLTELAQENKENIGKANVSLRNKILRGKAKIGQNVLGAVLNDINTSVKDDTVADVPAQTAANTGGAKNTTKDISELGNLLKEAENQPAKSKAKPVRQKVNRNAPKAQPINPEIVQNEVKSTPDKTLNAEEIMQAADDFIYGRALRYSVKVKDFAKDKENALKMLEHLKAEFAKRPKKDEDKVKRGKLFKLATVVAAESIEDDNVKQALTDLLKEMSKVARNDYIKYEQNKENPKDDFVVYMASSRNMAIEDLLAGISKTHMDEVFAELKEQSKQDAYLKWIGDFMAKAEEKAKAANEVKLQKEAERKAKAEERAKARAEAKAKAEEEKKKKQQEKKDTKSKETKTGDTTMADKDDGKKAETLTAEQEKELKELAAKGIDTASVKTPDDFKNKIDELRKKAEELDGTHTGGEASEEKGGKPAEGEGKDGKPAEGEGKPAEGLTVEGEGKEGGRKPEEIEAPELAEWIKKKIKDYQDMADGKIEGCPKLMNYKHNEAVKNGFAASFNGGEIHYTSPHLVTVSKESGLTVFEALVTEPDNRGKPVHFGEGLEHNQAALLLAACLVHGNPVGNNAPKLTAEDLKAIEAALKDRPEDLKKFQENAGKYIAAKEEEGKEKKATDSKEGGEKTAAPKAFDDKTKAEIKSALDRQYEMAKLESTGLINKTPDGTPVKNPKKNEDGSDKYSTDDFNKYMALHKEQKKDKDYLAGKFIENPEEVRALMKELVNEKTGKADTKDVNFADRRAIVEVKMKAKGDEKVKVTDREFIISRRKKLQEEMKMALGIIPNKDGERKVDLDYIKNNHINAYTYGRLGGTSEDVAKQCGPIKEGGDVMKEFAAGKQVVKDLADKAKGGGREA